MPSGEKLPELNQQRAELKRQQQLSNYIVDETTGCHIFQGGIGKDGYGKVKRHGKTLRMHRVVYAEAHGVELTPKDVIMHKCDNPPCINKDHLQLGDHNLNELDKTMKGRRTPSPSISHPDKVPRGEKHPRAVLTEAIIDRIRTSGDSDEQLAKEYGVSRSTIQRANRGTTWASIK